MSHVVQTSVMSEPKSVFSWRSFSTQDSRTLYISYKRDADEAEDTVIY